LHLGSVVANGAAADVAADEDLRRYYLGVVTS
jgi:ABC-type lipopolysaccharide export system ATPase subunit